MMDGGEGGHARPAPLRLCLLRQSGSQRRRALSSASEAVLDRDREGPMTA